MFKKQFRIKSNVQVKGSERKNLKDTLLQHFPSLTNIEAEELFSKKEILNCVKVCTADNEIIQVYTIQKKPMFFDVHGRLFPTIFMLWKYPNLIHFFTIAPQVMPFITSGADLMLPGVVTPSAQSGLPKYGSVQENDIVYVNLSTNKAAIAVGIASQSSGAMMLANGKGKCVKIYHFYGDKLCLFESNSPFDMNIPNLGPLNWLILNDYESDFPTIGSKNPRIENREIPENVEVVPESEEKPEDNVEEKDDDMDQILWHCFLSAIKYSKSISLPILTSNFYKLQMLPVCPPNKTLDIKKTSYKKLKTFLTHAEELGIITVQEQKKGVEAIIATNKDHPKVSEFYVQPEYRPKKENNDIRETNIIESYIITQNVLPIFQDDGYQKGDTIQGLNVRKLVVKYVKEKNCQNSLNSKLVKPDSVLKSICKTENSVSWEEVIEKVCDSMKNCFKVSCGNEQFINKGKISPITMAISVRSGNKKVTLIDNLELFGINMAEFAKECQHGVGASTSFTPKTPGKKCDQLLVQGNQILFIYDLLTEKYRIPKKYIRGLENAPKRKK